MIHYRIIEQLIVEVEGEEGVSEGLFDILSVCLCLYMFIYFCHWLLKYKNSANPITAQLHLYRTN